MSKRTSAKPSKYERSYRILEYLRKNSDSGHTITQASLRKVPELSDYIGDKETYNDTIVNMAMAMNFDADELLKPKDEWKINFKQFSCLYGDETNSESGGQTADKDAPSGGMSIRGLYYNHTFSYEEIDCLIESVLFSKTLDTQTADRLIHKIENHLTTRFYHSCMENICKIYEPVMTDRENIRKNLLLIQKAINEHVQISFRFNGYTHQKTLKPVRDTKDTVSPYYIIASNGRYYLLACREIHTEQKPVRNMSVWRIDLMTELEIPKRNERLGISGIPALKKQEVENLPLQWSEDFQLSHLNMSFDRPIPIKLKIKSPKDDSPKRKRLRPDYTFMHDTFGDHFRYIRHEASTPCDDIVEVVCSPYAMVNWALQYSDRVEVVSPKHVREAVKAKIKNLISKYMEV